MGINKISHPDTKIQWIWESQIQPCWPLWFFSKAENGDRTLELIACHHEWCVKEALQKPSSVEQIYRTLGAVALLRLLQCGYLCLRLGTFIKASSSLSKAPQDYSWDTGFKLMFKQSGFAAVEFQCRRPVCNLCSADPWFGSHPTSLYLSSTVLQVPLSLVLGTPRCTLLWKTILFKTI